MDLFDIAVARKLAGGSGGGGGGGDSDFSTAQMTIANSSGAPFIGNGCQFDDEYGAFAIIYSEGNDVISLILYKGSSYIVLNNSISKNVVALSGDIEGIDDDFRPERYIGFIVTGDCTITIS